MTPMIGHFENAGRDLVADLALIGQGEPWIVVPMAIDAGRRLPHYGTPDFYSAVDFAPRAGDHLGAHMSFSSPGLIELSWRSWNFGALPDHVVAEVVRRIRPDHIDLRIYVHDLGEGGAWNMTLLLVGRAVARLADRRDRAPEVRTVPAARAPGKPFDGALQRQAVGMRRAGATATQIAGEIGCHVDTAHKLIAGVARGDDEAKREEVRRLRAAGHSVRETARIVGCTTRSVQRWTASPGPAPSRH